MESKKKIRFWVVIFFVCLLFTVTLWDHYFNSNDPIDQRLVSNLILMMGSLFSVAAALFSWSIESRLEITQRKVDQRTKELKEQNQELEKALTEIKVLRGFIPICSVCKKIRNDQGLWEQMELYIQEHTHAQFSHGICKDCVKTVYKDNLPGKA